MLKKVRFLTPDIIKEWISLHYATIKEDQYRGLRVVLTRTFVLA